MDLLGSSSNDEEEISFKINEGYAKSYEKWRKKEEKQKLLDKYGKQESTDSSSEEEEIRSTPQMDKDWLRAYAVVRFKQPRLYKEGERFFKDAAKPVSKKKEKATTLKDHERKFILEKGGIASDEESKEHQPYVGKSYFEEQEEIKKNLKDAIGDSSDNASDEENDLLVKAHKTEEQKEREENEYLEWLKGERESLGDPDAEAELAPLKQYWNDPSLNEKERVLRDYILNNGYMDQEESDSDTDNDSHNLKEGPDHDEEEKFLEEAEKYEHKYNFRHEEPGGDEIKSYPRVIETSVRTKDTRRAEKRKEKLERKRKEKEKVKDEIRLLQKLQMEEKIEKLEKLRKIAHRPDLDYDLDADFDPEQHNEIMKKYFNEDYYEEEDADQKPTFDYDAAIDEEEDDWWKERLQEEKEEEGNDENVGGPDSEAGEALKEEEEDMNIDDPNFIMDADYDPSRDYKAEKKRAKKYGKVLAKKLPVFDPSTKTFDEYIDEYLKDKINDLPFTYRKVVPNDYGLTTEEILSLPDRELNAWVSVKKMSQFRTSREEIEERRRYQNRANDMEKKKKLLPSLFEKQGENPEANSKKKKKKRKRKRTEVESDAEDQETEALAGAESQYRDSTLHPTKKLKRSLSTEAVNESPKANKPEKKKKKNASVCKGNTSNNAFEGKQRSGSNSKSGAEIDNSKSTNDRKKLKKERRQENKISNLNKDSDPERSHHTESVHKGKEINTAKEEIIMKKSNKKQDSDAISDKVIKQKKKKKMENAGEDKRKKKKLSINMSKKLKDDDIEGKPDNKNLERQLSKIMSASRLSKYGLGPKASLDRKKKKKKKKEQ